MKEFKSYFEETNKKTHYLSYGPLKDAPLRTPGTAHELIDHPAQTCNNFPKVLSVARKVCRVANKKYFQFPVFYGYSNF